MIVAFSIENLIIVTFHWMRQKKFLSYLSSLLCPILAFIYKYMGYVLEFYRGGTKASIFFMFTNIPTRSQNMLTSQHVNDRVAKQRSGMC